MTGPLQKTVNIQQETEVPTTPSRTRNLIGFGWLLGHRHRTSFSRSRDDIQIDSDSNTLSSSARVSSENATIAELENEVVYPDSAVDLVKSELKVDPKEASSEPPYHVFTRAKKKRMVYIVSLAGFFSPLSSNIYFPALTQISESIGVSLSLVSLTVTVYMIVQGIAPSFWGPLSDTKGRRIVFIWTFVVYLISNIALAFSNNIVALMVFRGIQAGGSAATISVGAGVIGDIAVAKERGSLIGIFGGIRMMGQSIGPVFGGLISQYLGFQAIFWFLFGLGAAAVIIIILFLPETHRSIAGDGTVRLAGINRPVFYTPPADDVVTILEDQPKRKLNFRSILSPLRFLFEKDVFATLFFGSIVYTVWSMVTSTSSALFSQYFHLNTLEIGLAFLPNGAGCVSGSILTGYLMDYDYRRTEAEYKLAKGIPSDFKLNRNELSDFPIEKSRLRNIWWIVAIFVATTAGYGFSLKLSNMALALILQFLIAYTATSVFSFNSALVVDLYPGASASATAVNNLIRCSMGAIGVAVAQPIIESLDASYTFLMLAGVTAVCAPLLTLEWRWGSKWRLERVERLARQAERRRLAAEEKGLKT
ncbi:MAG: hypothetical protein M1818_004043 [Claussenomyces sp. TS43310]|nr:MAG: hypothetical protein M1818_004043 [Claussenomyces sp. TS43310]